MNHRLACWLAIALVGLIAGCTNPYEATYRPSNVTSATAQEQFAGDPRIETARSTNGRQEVARMFQNGYGLIGTSAFVSSAQGESEALAQAKKVGAAVVVVWQKYRNTESGLRSYEVPTTSTVTSSGTVSGSGGSASYSGTSTVYGTRTEVEAYSIDKYEHAALYFVPLKRSGVGVLMGPMTDDQKRAAGTNRGSAVVAVQKGSPAYNADILPGDIILSVDGRDIVDGRSASAALKATQGREATYLLSRDGRQIAKKVTVPYGDW